MTISKAQLTGIGEFETWGSVKHCIVDGMHALGLELLEACITLRASNSPTELGAISLWEKSA